MFNYEPKANECQSHHCPRSVTMCSARAIRTGISHGHLFLLPVLWRYIFRVHQQQNGRQKQASGTESVGFEVLTAVIMKNSVSWDMTPCSPANQVMFRSNISLSSKLKSKLYLLLASCLLHDRFSLALKMDAICSFETLVDFHRTTQSYIPEDNCVPRGTVEPNREEATGGWRKLQN
jgi:hypothetical protein